MTTVRAAVQHYTMPVPGFLTSFADKAQSAINTSPLASLTSDGSSGHKHTLESFSNQLRVISQQYSYVDLLLHNRIPTLACTVLRVPYRR